MWFSQTFVASNPRSTVAFALTEAIDDIVQDLSPALGSSINAQIISENGRLNKVYLLFGHLDSQFGNVELVRAFQEAVLRHGTVEYLLNGDVLTQLASCRSGGERGDPLRNAPLASNEDWLTPSASSRNGAEDGDLLARRPDQSPPGSVRIDSNGDVFTELSLSKSSGENGGRDADVDLVPVRIDGDGHGDLLAHPASCRNEDVLEPAVPDGAHNPLAQAAILDAMLDAGPEEQRESKRHKLCICRGLWELLVLYVGRLTEIVYIALGTCMR
ncbi:hypothetical protein C8F01DRAFT_468465 [Mycena amicta]|nr:hypothetical protein C8F01DRAFT_468465 [Mycena amicta]